MGMGKMSFSQVALHYARIHSGLLISGLESATSNDTRGEKALEQRMGRISGCVCGGDWKVPPYPPCGMENVSRRRIRATGNWFTESISVQIGDDDRY